MTYSNNITKQDLSLIIKSPALLANLVVGIFFHCRNLRCIHYSDLSFLTDELVEER